MRLFEWNDFLFFFYDDVHFTQSNYCVLKCDKREIGKKRGTDIKGT